MLRYLVAAVALVAVASALPLTEDGRPLAPLYANGELIENEYIVIADPLSRASFAVLEAEVSTALKATGGQLMFNYTDAVTGFAVKADAKGIEEVRRLRNVKFVEQNQKYYAIDHPKAASCATQEGATWGLVRTSERNLKIDGRYYYADNSGEGVDAYIVDTGIYTEHEDFEGRAVWGTDTVDDPSPKTDSNGHGTHVAGTVGSKTYGLAKKATLIAVKVLGASGSGSTAGVIAGIDWVAKQHKAKNGKKPSTANMSLGGGYSSAMNDATEAAVAAGVAFAVAAGNENQDACRVSPASAKAPMTVGATDNTDKRSYFSNYGSCVDIFAPGSDITSTWINGKDSDNTISGTSMASPHVCGEMAKYLTANPNATPAEVNDALTKAATENKIDDAKSGSPNLLLFGSCQ